MGSHLRTLTKSRTLLTFLKELSGYFLVERRWGEKEWKPGLSFKGLNEVINI